jgi:nucleoside diphosphate kinase
VSLLTLIVVTIFLERENMIQNFRKVKSLREPAHKATGTTIKAFQLAVKKHN